MKKIIVTAAVVVIASFIFLTSFQAKLNNTNHIRFNHIAIYVADLEASKAFYKDVMEFEAMDEPFHDGRHAWFRIGDHSQLHVVTGEKKEQLHIRNNHLAFSVSFLAGFIKKLDEKKISYINWAGDQKAAGKRPDGIQQIYLQDPDGYWIEVNDEWR